jgi:lipopolysaccharide export system protein LptA
MWRALLLAGMWLCTAMPAWAADAPPTTITADRMMVRQLKQTAVFEGNVALHREQFVLTCDRLVVHYNPKKSGELRQAEAYGHVKIRHEQTSGSAKEARYDQQAGVVTLIGNAELTEPGRTVHAERIVHNLRKQSTQVKQGGSGRVRLHIDSDKGTGEPAPSGGGKP